MSGDAVSETRLFTNPLTASPLAFMASLPTQNPASYAGYQKLGVGDQNFRTGRQQATNLLSHQHLKFQGKSAFFKRKHEAPVGNCSKTKRRFYNHHIYLVPDCFSGFSQYGYCGRKRDMARSKCRVKTHFHISNWP